MNHPEDHELRFVAAPISASKSPDTMLATNLRRWEDLAAHAQVTASKLLFCCASGLGKLHSLLPAAAKRR